MIGEASSVTSLTRNRWPSGDAAYSDPGGDGHRVSLLPQPRDAVFIEDSVVGDDGKILDLGLGDKHAIERISMRPWKSAGPLRVEDRDIQAVELLSGKTARDAGGHLQSAGQLANPGFGRDLPCRSGAHEDRVGLVGNGPVGPT